jgi:hypothetical protein
LVVVKKAYFWAAFASALGFALFDILGPFLLNLSQADWSGWLLVLILIEIGIVGTITIFSFWD